MADVIMLSGLAVSDAKLRTLLLLSIPNADVMKAYFAPNDEVYLRLLSHAPLTC